MVFTSFETVTEKQNLTKENDTSTTATEEMPDTGKTGTMRSSVCLKKKNRKSRRIPYKHFAFPFRSCTREQSSLLCPHSHLCSSHSSCFPDALQEQWVKQHYIFNLAITDFCIQAFELVRSVKLIHRSGFSAEVHWSNEDHRRIHYLFFCTGCTGWAPLWCKAILNNQHSFVSANKCTPNKQLLNDKSQKVM